MDEYGNTIKAEKLKSKLLNFFKASQFKPDSEEKNKKMKKHHIILNYDRIKIAKPKNNQIKAFITVLSREDGVKIYDYFYKLKSKKFSSVIYLIISNEILKKHTIKEMKKHEDKKKRQKEELQKVKAEETAKKEKEKRLDLSTSIIKEQDEELSESSHQDY